MFRDRRRVLASVVASFLFLPRVSLRAARPGRAAGEGRWPQPRRSEEPGLVVSSPARCRDRKDGAQGSGLCLSREKAFQRNKSRKNNWLDFPPASISFSQLYIGTMEQHEGQCGTEAPSGAGTPTDSIFQH